jgi:EamA domain-containing membrane protein RarD
MIEIVDLLKIGKYRNIYLANLNLRLFLYGVQDGQIRNSLGFLLNALRRNSLEIFITVGRIFLKRALRRFKEKKSFFPNP